jgi:hypothetical protein
MRKVRDEMTFGVEDLRADRDAQFDVVSVCTMLPGAASRPAATGDPTPLRAERRQVAEVGIGDEHDVSAAATVPAVGAAARYVLLAPEGERAVSPTPCRRSDAGAVVEQDEPC